MNTDIHEQKMDINELTYQINGAIFEVNRVLGVGFLEKVYERSLLVELQNRGLEAESQVPIKVMYSPGHTRDSISLIFPDKIFTGDALFLDDGGAGRDDLPGGDPAAHWETLRKFWELPDSWRRQLFYSYISGTKNKTSCS